MSGPPDAVNASVEKPLVTEIGRFGYTSLFFVISVFGRSAQKHVVETNATPELSLSPRLCAGRGFLFFAMLAQRAHNMKS